MTITGRQSGRSGWIDGWSEQRTEENDEIDGERKETGHGGRAEERAGP